jgi:hypothetical protein
MWVAAVQRGHKKRILKYSIVSISMGNMFQDLPWLCEIVDNTEHYI